MASGIWHLACQTYALNLIDSHSGQKQAPQLFSSPKSFRVAKSTSSSRSLPPISKRLSKPPLLFKSALFFAPLLLLSYTQGVQALTAQTSRVIEGSGPYLTFDGGRTKVTDTNNLLYIELPDGRAITPSNNTSSPTNPIMLPRGNYTFNDIHTVLPSGTTSISLNSLISQGKWGDDDGDGQGAGGVTASGNILLTIQNKDGLTISRGDTLNKCSAPYKVILSSTGGSLTTRYGVPNRSTFSGGSIVYYITTPQSGICSVRPNLYFGGTRVYVSFPGGGAHFDDPRYAGPSSIWSPTKGFLVQSTTPSTYYRNFPTTGADGLYFDLEIPTGIDGSQLRWTVNTSGSIRATVNWRRPLTGTFIDPGGYTIQADDWIRDKSGNVARVTLHGPEARSQWNNYNPGQITVPPLPQTFELVGRDSNGNEVRYGFKLKQWFVSRGGQLAPYTNQSLWCNRLGYRMPKVRDLTNSDYNNLGASPRSSGNYYQRHIGAGFFTEWGDMDNYNASFTRKGYWTSDASGSDKFVIYGYHGLVDSRNASNDHPAVCTTP